MRVVLDTNVLVSGLVRRTPTAPPAQLIDLWRSGMYVLVLSEYILAEVSRTLEQPYFHQGLTPELIAQDLVLLREETVLTPITVEVRGVATHPEDDDVLAAAVSAQADYLVTGDKKLQELGRYAGVIILSPRAFMDVIAAQ